LAASSPVRAIVVGGGIVGASVALGLSQRGWRVALYDRGRLGGASTARAAGVVSELTWNEQDRLWVAESRERYLRPPGGGDAVFRRTGSLAWARGDDARRLAGHGERLERAGVPIQWLDAAVLRDRYPALRVDADGQALLLPEDGLTDAAAYAVLAGREIVRLGGEVHEDSAVSLALGDGGAIGVVLPGGAVRRAEAVLVAAGAWSAKLLRGLDLWAPLRPYRTQLAAVAHPRAADLPRTVFHDVELDWYWVPEAPGRMLAGDGTEDVESDPDTFRQAPDAWFLEDIAHRLAARTAEGDQATIGRAYAGILTATPDRRPLLGPVPGVDGVWLAAGMNGFGVMRGPAIGDAVAARLAAGDATGLADCRPDRVPWQPPQFPIRPGYTL
jgi:sarcosine oxidase subunit beta